MALDLIALAILVLFTLMGALRGGVASVTSLMTLLLSYGAAVWAAPSLGPNVSAKLGLPGYAGPAVAGTVAFLGSAVFLGVLGAVIKSWAKSLRGDSPMGMANRWVGGFFGALRGGLIVVLLAWLAIWLDAAREAGALGGLEAMPRVEHSGVARVTEKVVQGVVHAAVDADDTTADVLARLASRPGSAVRSLQALLANPRIEALQRDRFFWTLIENGAVSRAMNRQSFQDIARNDAMRAQFAEVGVISEQAAQDPAVFREEFGHVLAEVGPRVKDLVNDPELQRLARDPEVASMLQSGDTLGLIRHEGIQRLASKISHGSS